jgi:perosamine synthetase
VSETLHPIAAARPLIGDDERAAVDRVMRSGMLAQGPEVAAFEEEFSKVVGGRPCVAVNSGTSALHLGLLANGVRPGDEVIVPSFSFAATANAVALTGATPVFADIDPHDFCVSAEAVEAAITSRTVGVMPVHLYGHPADMDGLLAVTRRHSLALYEDAAQAHLASWRGRPVGSFGTMAAFSFYPTKNMTSGEGGMVVCADEATARQVRLLRNQGMEKRYANEVVGFNTRMTDVHAAIGRVQLGRLPEWTRRRQANAATLSAGLADCADVQVPRVAASAVPVWHQYTVRSTHRDALMERLDEAGIGYGVYYPTPIHRLPSFDQQLDLPQTELAADEVLSLPVHPSLSPSDLDRIIAAVRGEKAE